MKRMAAIIAVWLLGATGAAAQNQVIEHYRSYQDALAANDLPAAEAAAAAALSASEARDGDGGATAVLALNLATVRFMRGDAQGTLAPAERALALARAQGEGARVSPVLAELVIGRAELALNQAGAAARTLAALEQAQAARLEPAEIYDAAVELGRASFRALNYGQARQAWSIAANYAEGARYAPAYAMAVAQTGAAASIILEDTTRGFRDRGVLRRGVLREETAIQARRELSDAVSLLRPLAEIESPDGRMTLAQSGYAQALAWRAVLRAKIRSDDMRLPNEEDESEAQGDGAGEIDVPAAAIAQPRCLVRLHYARNLSSLFPAAALDAGALAGMAVRFEINEAGNVIAAETAAIVGLESFSRSIENSWRHWRASRLDESPPNCRMAMTLIVPVSFSVQ